MVLSIIQSNNKNRNFSEFENYLKYSENSGKVSSVTHVSMGNKGYIGNQMFQVALLCSLSIDYGCKYFLPKRVKNMPITDICNFSNIEFRNTKPDYYIPESKNYRKISIPKNGKTYDLRGYLQCYKYFDHNKSEIIRLLKPRDEIINKIKKYLPSKFLMLHIRRSDYVDSSRKLDIFREHTICEKQYYKYCLEEMQKYFPNIKVYISTDDRNRVMKEMGDFIHEKHLSFYDVGGIKPVVVDFVMMYLSTGLIMSNSTFCWWASYLSEKKAVVIPSLWWNEKCYLQKMYNLNGYYLYYPGWLIVNPETLKVEERKTLKDDDNKTWPISSHIRSYFV